MTEAQRQDNMAEAKRSEIRDAMRNLGRVLLPARGDPATPPDLPELPFACEPVKDATRRSRGGSSVALLDSLFASGMSPPCPEREKPPFPGQCTTRKPLRKIPRAATPQHAFHLARSR